MSAFEYTVPQTNIDFSNQGSFLDNNFGANVFGNNQQANPDIFGSLSSLGRNPASGTGVGVPGAGINTTYGLFDQNNADGIKTQQGLLSPVLGAATGIFNIYAGLKALGQQEDALNFQKEAFNKNFAANKAAFQENLRTKFGRKATLGGNKGTTEKEFVDTRSNF